MAKAKKMLTVRCHTCGASFKAASRLTRICPAHGHKRPEPNAPVDDVGGRTWVPAAKIKLADKVDQWLLAHDAANECVHGALPHDKKLPAGCECWGERYDFEKPEEPVELMAAAGG